MHHPVLTFILEFRRKNPHAYRQRLPAYSIPKNNVVRPYDRYDHEIISNNRLLQVNMQQAGVTDKQVGCSRIEK